jgi:hypothetical protein
MLFIKGLAVVEHPIFCVASSAYFGLSFRNIRFRQSPPRFMYTGIQYSMDAVEGKSSIASVAVAMDIPNQLAVQSVTLYDNKTLIGFYLDCNAKVRILMTSKSVPH